MHAVNDKGWHDTVGDGEGDNSGDTHALVEEERDHNNKPYNSL
jgi:hypothetical protein